MKSVNDVKGLLREWDGTWRWWWRRCGGDGGGRVGGCEDM